MLSNIRVHQEDIHRAEEVQLKTFIKLTFKINSEKEKSSAFHTLQQALRSNFFPL